MSNVTNNNNRRVRRNRTTVRRNRPNTTNIVKSEVGINVAAKNPKQNQIQPQFRLQKFKWEADFANITNSGNAYAGKMMYANNLYDPDPALLTSAVSGYADNMDFYFYCLPYINKTHVVVTNREAFPVKVCLLFSIQQVDLLFTSSQAIIDLGENPISTPWTEISAVGGQDRATLNLKVNLAQANGNEFEFNGNAETYSCQPTSGPPFPMFVSLLVWSSTNFTAAGVGVSWQMTWNTRLWSRRIVLDSGPTLAKRSLHLKLKNKEVELKSLQDRVKILQELEHLDEQHADLYGQLQEQVIKELLSIQRLRGLIDNPYQYLTE